jgi:hypothetical protein
MSRNNSGYPTPLHLVNKVASNGVWVIIPGIVTILDLYIYWTDLYLLNPKSSYRSITLLLVSTLTCTAYLVISLDITIIAIIIHTITTRQPPTYSPIFSSTRP